MSFPDVPKPATDEPHFRKADWPFYWITQVSARYYQLVEKSLKPMGLDVAQWRVLMSLYEGDALSISEIAEFCIIKLNTTTKIIQRMAAEGLVTCRPRKTDGRVTEVLITDKGNRLRREGRSVANGIFERSFASLGGEDIHKLNHMLEQVFHNLDAD